MARPLPAPVPCFTSIFLVIMWDCHNPLLPSNWSPLPEHSSMGGCRGCRQCRLVDAREEGTPQVVMVTLQQLAALSSVRVFIHKDLRPPEHCQHGVMVHPAQSLAQACSIATQHRERLGWSCGARSDLAGEACFLTCSSPCS